MKDRRFCRKCWTEFDASTEPLECPHLNGAWVYTYGVHWPQPLDLTEAGEEGLDDDGPLQWMAQ